MQRRLLRAWSGSSPDPLVRALARAVLEGDAAALPLLSDRLQETGECFMLALKVGQAYLIRTFQRSYTGRVKAVSFTEVVLEEAAIIPSYGVLSYHETLRSGDLREVDPLPGEIIISTGVIIDAVPWAHKLPREPRVTNTDPPDDIPF